MVIGKGAQKVFESIILFASIACALTVRCEYIWLIWMSENKTVGKLLSKKSLHQRCDRRYIEVDQLMWIRVMSSIRNHAEKWT